MTTLGPYSTTDDVAACYPEAAAAMKHGSVIVTGSNTGMGKQTAVALAKLRATVILACRNMEKGSAARLQVQAQTNNPNVHFIQLDLESLKSVSTFVKEFNRRSDEEKWPPLTHLICNAGLFPTPECSYTQGRMETTFAVSHLGHFGLTTLLLRNLRRVESRVIMVSSGSHQGPLATEEMTSRREVLEKIVYPDRNKYSRFKCYGSSKLCNAIFANALYEREKENNIHCASLHPGTLIATDIARGNVLANFVFKYIISWFTKTVDQACSTTLACCLMPAEQLKGQYFEDCQLKKPGDMVYNTKAGDILWEVSYDLLVTHSPFVAFSF